MALMPTSRSAATAEDAKRYFTGKPCTNGHISERHTGSGHCIDCDRENTARYIALNPERVSEWRRERYAARREEERGNARKRYAAERSVRIARSKRWYRDNPEKARARSQRYCELNKEMRAAHHKAYVSNNREKIRAHNHAARARKNNAPGRYSSDDVAKIRAMQKDRCACCKTRLSNGGQVDHIIALTRGGSNWPRNLQLLCKPCNVSKLAKDPIDFMQSRGRLL